MNRVSPKAVALGLLVMVALDMLLGIGALVLQSGEIFTERQSDEQISNTLDAVAKSTRFLLESVFVGAITTAIGGYVAARIAKRHSYFNGVALGAVGALLGLAFWAEYPLWFNLAALATVFPASLLGAHVAVRLGASGAEPGVQPGSPPAGVPVATPSDRGDGGQAASSLLADGRKNTDTPTPSVASARAGTAPSNPHVLWRQVLGFVFWVGLLSLPVVGRVGAAMFLTLGAAAFADAWTSGIYKRRDTSSFLNISPMSWGIAMALLSLVAYPAYLLNRKRLRTIHATNIYYWATVIIGAIILILFTLNLLGAIATRAK